MHKGNLLIRASAGTGKTFSLATRYLQLMLLNDEDPAKIVALTFSRAAAQEIYTKILERLWKASESEENAAKESENICKDLGLTLSWNKARFSSLLRNLLEAQHLGTIATLDSFILRMVRNFPLEVGFQHAVEVLDPADEGAAVQDALRVILQGTDKVEDFIKVFEAAREGVLPRVLKYLIESMLKGWRGFVELHPESREWTASSMCAALGIPEKPELPDLSGLNTAGTSNPCEKFIQLAMAYDGTGDLFPDNNTGKMMRHFVRNPQTTVFSWTTPGGKERSFDYGVEGAAKIRAAIKCMFNVYVLRRLKKVEAQLKFAWFVEDVYNRTSRRKGKLTFSDFTKFSAAKEGSEQEFVLQNLEYRLDRKSVV